MPLPIEDLAPLKEAIPYFDSNPKYPYLAEKKLLPQQQDIESFESPSFLTHLRRMTYGYTRKEQNLLKQQEEA